LSGQSVVVNAGSAAGMLAGGPIIGAVGAEYTLVGSGLITALVAVLVLVRCQAAEHAGVLAREPAEES
jgi:predicted MFS family arabinose efflux permease